MNESNTTDSSIVKSSPSEKMARAYTRPTIIRCVSIIQDALASDGPPHPPGEGD